MPKIKTVRGAAKRFKKQLPAVLNVNNLTYVTF